jgi:hypothetical protein
MKIKFILAVIGVIKEKKESVGEPSGCLPPASVEFLLLLPTSKRFQY